MLPPNKLTKTKLLSGAIKLNSISYRRDRARPCPQKNTYKIKLTDNRKGCPYGLCEYFNIISAMNYHISATIYRRQQATALPRHFLFQKNASSLYKGAFDGQGQALSLRYDIIFTLCEAPTLNFTFLTPNFSLLTPPITFHSTKKRPKKSAFRYLFDNFSITLS